MHPMLTIAIRAARAAGDIIVREMDRVSDLTIDSKGKNDFVSEVDRNAEDAIIYTIQQSYPDHAFLCEETGQRGESEFVWIIDPLDGTKNFYMNSLIMLCRLPCNIKADWIKLLFSIQ